MVWRWVAAPNGRLTKPPFRADNPTVYAKSDDPQTWASYTAAKQTYEQGLADGIGYALTNSRLAAIDLDNCRDPESGVLAPWAQRLLDGCGSYAEITPSKRGIRIIGKASGAKLHRKLPAPDGGSVEVYRDAERYITVSGDTLTPDISQLGDIDALCDQVVVEFDQKKPPPPLQKQPAPSGDDRSLEDLIQNGCGTSFGGDKSRATWRVINLMLEAGDDRDKIARVLTNPANGISVHCLSKPGDPVAYALRQIDKAASERMGDDEITRLAKLPPLQYEKRRTLAAKELEIRASGLDKLVGAKRAGLGLGDDTDKQGKSITFPEIEPWPEKVDGAGLLDKIDDAFARHIVMSETARTISAVWPVHAHIFDRFVVTPRLCVRSAVKDSGKTTYFSVLSHVVPRVLMTASATPAAVFRAVGAYRPVLLIDEAAGMFDEAGELRRILNAGYRFDGHVLRSVGDSFEPRLFKVFAPVAFALVGKLPADLHSRCICIDLQRKLASEKIEPYRIGKMQHLDVLARKIVRWTNDNVDAIVQAKPALPSSLVNRSSDLWAIMLSVATVAGGNWPRRIEQAIAASLEVGDDDSTWFEQLIRDIHSVFGEREAVSSVELVTSLVAMEGRPWPELGKSRKPLTQARLASMLRGPGFCVTPTQIRFRFGDTETQLRGYARWQFDDLFARYLSIPTPSGRHSVTNADDMGTCDTSQSVTASVTDISQGVTGVTDSGVTDSPCDTCDTSKTTCDTSCDTSQSVTNPDEISIRDAVTLSEGGKGGISEVAEGGGVRSPMEIWASETLDGKPVKP
jgi:putative DNA primase/helicase